MPRILLRSVLIAFCAIAVLYAFDAIAWNVRSARGTGTDEVTVAQVTAARLKRDREEYYSDGSIAVTCARSLFPQRTADEWLPPCWYLRRHPMHITHL